MLLILNFTMVIYLFTVYFAAAYLCIEHMLHTVLRTSHIIKFFKNETEFYQYENTYAADQASTSLGCVRMAAFVNCFRISGSSGGMCICSEQ